MLLYVGKKYVHVQVLARKIPDCVVGFAGRRVDPLGPLMRTSHKVYPPLGFNPEPGLGFAGEKAPFRIRAEVAGMRCGDIQWGSIPRRTGLPWWCWLGSRAGLWHWGAGLSVRRQYLYLDTKIPQPGLKGEFSLVDLIGPVVAVDRLFLRQPRARAELLM